MANHDDLFARAKTLDIYQVLLPYCPNLKKEAGGYAGPCPVCGGNNRFSITTRKNCCHCRKECGISGDTVTAWAKIRGISNLESARELLGESTTPKDWTPVRVEFTPPAPEQDWKDPAWQSKAKARIKKAKPLGMTHDEGVSKYLWDRGLGPVIYDLFGIKDAMVWHPSLEVELPAAMVPWIYYDHIVNLKYRFIDDIEPRFTSLKGGQPILFGSQVEAVSNRLILTEGEFNAMSCKLASLEDHAWSIGAQGSKEHSTLAVEAAVYVAKERGITEVVGFIDEWEYARNVRDAFEASGIKCSVICSQFGDANQVLVKYGKDWLKWVIDGAFERPNCVCQRCSGLGVLPYLERNLYQICPDCAHGEEGNE